MARGVGNRERGMLVLARTTHRRVGRRGVPAKATIVDLNTTTTPQTIAVHKSVGTRNRFRIFCRPAWVAVVARSITVVCVV